MKLLVLLTFLSTASCGAWNRTYTSITNEATTKCYNGVTYLQSDSGMALLVDVNGKPVPCKE